MAATGSRSAYGASNTINMQAQLGNAYQELGKELGTETLKVVGGYTLGRVIGEGTYGSVHLATHRLTGTRCAIKKIPKSFTTHLTRELHHHRRLHHPNIVHLHEIVATESNVWLVTELCSGGELFDYLVERGRLLIGEARRMFGELVVAVGWLHKQGVVHRDLKLENVLLDGELRIKLGDLGFAREWQRGRLMETYCGTTGYASPEMLAGRKYFGVETDLWSLGIILYTLLCGGLPFDDDDETVMKSLIAKGEYEEPEWLSQEARSLIRGLLQPEPTQRLSVEAILNHSWFKMTIVDQTGGGDKYSLPATPNPEILPNTGQTTLLSDVLLPRGDPGSSSRNLASHPSNNPSSLTIQATTAAPDRDSEPSETSLDFADSDQGKADSGVTTPTTAEDEDTGKDSLPRAHSGDFNQTEKALELLHSNTSQSTIRRAGTESPHLSAVRTKVAVKSPLEGQTEVDEEAGLQEDDISTDLPQLDELLHLPLAQHSRTPSRTKRRSVSSQLSLERKYSHHSATGHWQSYVAEDYLTQLNQERAKLFSRPAEKHLLEQLAALGFDLGQLVHSVTSDACDASAAMWWILRMKQIDRGETDEVIDARNSSAARRRERAAAYAREERRKAKAKQPSREASPVVRDSEVKFQDEIPAFHSTPDSVKDHANTMISSSVTDPPEILLPTSTSANGILQPSLSILEWKTAAAANDETSGSTQSKLPRTPPQDDEDQKSERLSSSIDISLRERGMKNRSPSMSMLQRATSAFIISGKKNEEKEKQQSGADTIPINKGEGRSVSPTKLVKLHPKPKMTKSQSEATLLGASHNSPASLVTITSPSSTPGRGLRTVSRAESPATSSSIQDPLNAASLRSSSSLHDVSAKLKAPKRDSLWTAFRQMFNEDRRRRKREAPGSAVPHDHMVKMSPAVVLARGPAARSPHVGRVPQPTSGSRRASMELRPAMYSRRSSSVNSRRSSVNSTQLTTDLHETLSMLGRRTSHVSYGSQTPTSDREYGALPEIPSRPSSAQSASRGGKRSSSGMSRRSPSMQSDSSGRFKGQVPASPLHNYQRRPSSGSASIRVRHYRVIADSHLMRSASIASSVRSTASSRASSIDKNRLDEAPNDSDYDTGRDDASVRSRRRRSDEWRSSSSSLAQQTHRARSPLVDMSNHRKGGSRKKAPLRDVFHQKDEEWIDEDDDVQPTFAGGLGQTASTSHWCDHGSKNAKAASHPSVMTPPATKRKGLGHHRHHGRGPRSRRGSSGDERDAGRGRGVSVGEGDRERDRDRDDIMSGRRTGLPERTGKPPIVMEEVEEEDEE